MSSTGSRGYTLIDLAYPRRPGVDEDSLVRFMEYVRQHFREIVPGVPAECEVDLLASGHAHNIGLMPLLGLYAPRDVLARIPDFGGMIAAVERWSEALSDEQFWEIVRATEAPTWAALQAMGVHPQRG